MHTYLWSGKNSSGKELTEHVTATTPEEARQILQGRGWTDLQWHSSEIHEFSRLQVQSASDPNYLPNLTPDQERAYLQEGAPGFWTNWWRVAGKGTGTYLILAAWFVWALYRQQILSMILSSGLLVILLLLFPALHFWFGRTAELYQKLNEARNWRRWDEVLACLAALKRAQSSRKIGIGEAEMARYHALALAGLGRLDEGVTCFAQAAEAANMPRWLFYSHLASIHTVAEQYDQTLEFYRQALEQATEKGTVCIDYGACLVQRFNRPAEARQLLAIAESTPLTQLASFHLIRLKALIALREGDFMTANKLMSEALAGFERRAKGRRFVFEPSILLAHGYLGLIHAHLGNHEAARKHFAEAEKYLTTIRMDELIAEYRSKMGISSLPPSSRLGSGTS